MYYYYYFHFFFYIDFHFFFIGSDITFELTLVLAIVSHEKTCI